VKFNLRTFNKHVTNRLTGVLARNGVGPFALVCHVGRRSGTPYETPIIVVPVAGGFMIALTYGPEVDWYRNVLAAGGCRIRWHGGVYTVDDVRPVDVESARRAFPQPERAVLRLLGTDHFVRMGYRGVERVG
jgi:deazaflavin-dependent oxidoreductase (nitroreductase family)